MTLQQLRDFLAVIEHGSFRAAARFQDVSQAGLTNSLKALEAHLGTALLTRSGRGVQVTPAGEMLKARARLIHAERRSAQPPNRESHRRTRPAILWGGGAGWYNNVASAGVVCRSALL